MKAQAFLEETAALVERALDRWLPSATEEPRRLHEAMRYSLFAGGKRLRPAVARAACKALGGTDEEVLPAACALELLHTYSLIHDDLPAIDDDDLRRGRPSCHARFGEALAILAGDALQSAAFGILAAHTPRRDAVGALVHELAEAAGTRGMVGGEVADIEGEGKPVELERVRFIHARKTGALFAASAAMGGLAAGGEAETVECLRRYGHALGLAFQIVDDLLDETAESAVVGKPTGRDRARGKQSYPAAVGLDAAREAARRLAAGAQAALEALPGGDRELLGALADFTVTRIR